MLTAQIPGLHMTWTAQPASNGSPFQRGVAVSGPTPIPRRLCIDVMSDTGAGEDRRPGCVRERSPIGPTETDRGGPPATRPPVDAANPEMVPALHDLDPKTSFVYRPVVTATE